MPHYPQPFYRTARKAWYVQIEGKQYRLHEDRDEAFKKYHTLMAQAGHLVETAESSAASPKVTEVLERFLEWVQNNRAAGTYSSYKERLQSFIDYLREQSLLFLVADQLKPYHLRDWADSHKNWAAGMKRGRIGAVQRAFNHALEDSFIPRNPISKIRKPAQGRRETPIPLEAYETILASSASGAFKDLITVAWETGARPQELLRVEVKHVDLSNTRWVFESKKSKGKKKARVIYLNAKALEIVQRLAREAKAGALFRNNDGNPWHHHAVACVFSRLKEKLGKKYALVDFRHAWATRALKAGLGVVTVANLMGHSSPQMLASVYQHLDQDQEHLREVFKKIK
jgi:integrase/recombinase XerC